MLWSLLAHPLLYAEKLRAISSGLMTVGSWTMPYIYKIAHPNGVLKVQAQNCNFKCI